MTSRRNDQLHNLRMCHGEPSRSSSSSSAVVCPSCCSCAELPLPGGFLFSSYPLHLCALPQLPPSSPISLPPVSSCPFSVILLSLSRCSLFLGRFWPSVYRRLFSNIRELQWAKYCRGMTEAEDGFRFGGLLNFLFVVLLSVVDERTANRTS